MKTKIIKEIVRAVLTALLTVLGINECTGCLAVGKNPSAVTVFERN